MKYIKINLLTANCGSAYYNFKQLRNIDISSIRTGGEPDNIYIYKMCNCIHKQGLWIAIIHFTWSANMNAQIQLEATGLMSPQADGKLEM